MILYIIITIILLLIVLFVVYYRIEKFGDVLSHRKSTDVIDITKQFTDLVVYENDADGRLGLDKCMDQCGGNCVEYGQTGSAYCFKKVDIAPRNYNTSIAQNEEKLSFSKIE